MPLPPMDGKQVMPILSRFKESMSEAAPGSAQLRERVKNDRIVRK
jgi:hypothetical protein